MLGDIEKKFHFKSIKLPFELMPKSVKSKHRTKTDKTELYDYFYSIKKARNEMTGACVLPLVNT